MTTAVLAVAGVLVVCTLAAVFAAVERRTIGDGHAVSRPARLMRRITGVVEWVMLAWFGGVPLFAGVLFDTRAFLIGLVVLLGLAGGIAALRGRMKTRVLLLGIVQHVGLVLAIGIPALLLLLDNRSGVESEAGIMIFFLQLLALGSWSIAARMAIWKVVRGA